ncbi:MAG TPA: hypothetical protein VFS43_30005 [Polyangiaceae bacterium]|nr:hypothetical protein [Polyangiaceae bacterium]
MTVLDWTAEVWLLALAVASFGCAAAIAAREALRAPRARSVSAFTLPSRGRANG